LVFYPFKSPSTSPPVFPLPARFFFRGRLSPNEKFGFQESFFLFFFLLCLTPSHHESPFSSSPPFLPHLMQSLGIRLYEVPSVPPPVVSLHPVLDPQPPSFFCSSEGEPFLFLWCLIYLEPRFFFSRCPGLHPIRAAFSARFRFFPPEVEFFFHLSPSSPQLLHFQDDVVLPCLLSLARRKNRIPLSPLHNRSPPFTAQFLHLLPLERSLLK